MSLALQVEYNLKSVLCCECNTIIFMSNDMKNNLLRNHKSFYCINGHSQYFPSESDNEIL